MEIKIEDIVRNAAPDLQVVTIEANVTNHPTTHKLKE